MDAFGDEVYAQGLIVHHLQSDPLYRERARAEYKARGSLGPDICVWCRVSIEDEAIYRCRDLQCMDGLPACGPCILIGHQVFPFHNVEKWTEKRFWKRLTLADLGYVYQLGHDGLACPNPSADKKTRVVVTVSGAQNLSAGVYL
ncbi:hypothetical protein B0H11DRAFT_2231795 [Mycena galericulata]|nr:hypothetical protein B0H11DRAFT_2256229 [Mycena galericulata]KAJ7437315.1 hypothetical protein B0H11DRAFT_2255541 [Mycena galericulata]KAJ7439892.1 hypothetical protein B0H11DRAFT_2253426 [Mycena galericulata]KAJ7484063.1 hypothetical protein B0H11DRAFT_2231795 [Mycena galericulata]